MWAQVQRIWGGKEAKNAPPPVPLRKPALTPRDLTLGRSLRFAKTCPLAPLTGADASIIGIRSYRFGDDLLKSYQLQVGEAKHYYLTIAEDDQGQYLGISRALSELEQETWFGRDALSFFTEASSAKSIRCKADLMEEGEWAAARYSKTVDWVEGSVTPSESTRLTHSIHYSLLVNEAADKALEIEHEDANEENRFFITVYRPIDDIALLETDVKAAEPAPMVPANDDTPQFKEPALTLTMPQPKQRMDFRRLDSSNEPIHIERTPPSALPANEPEAQLPTFLLSRENEIYLALDTVIPPEPEKIRVGLTAARTLMEYAIRKNVRVRDVLREMLGLQSALSEEVIFEMPLSDEDYQTLAMRYKLRPDHRVEIRSRLEEELRNKLTSVAKN